MGPAGAPLAAVFGAAGQLLDKLAGAGVQPEDVQAGVLGHLHPDHIGWNLQPQDGSYRLTFPRARYVVHRADWEAFHRPEVQAHFPFPFVEQTITPLEGLGALELIDGYCQSIRNGRTITSDVRGLPVKYVLASKLEELPQSPLAK
jgi:glyoxylase-like metal-dependent hydrolase (beta-lactamase superfamily II)